MSLDQHELLLKILEARYELEICEESDKARRLANFHTLLDRAIGSRNLSRHELWEAMRDRMKEYRAARRKQERPWGTV